MRATNFDWILQQEEKKLNRLLEGLNLTSSELNEVKSTNPTDKPGLVSRGSMRTTFNFTENAQITKKSVAVQTMIKPTYDVNDELLQISDKSEKPRVESFLTSINKWQGFVSDQVKSDLEAQISQKSQALHESNKKVQELETALREMIQWRNTTLNYITLALNTWDRNLMKGAQGSKVSPILLANINDLHKGILSHLHDDANNCHLPERFEQLKTNPKSNLREPESSSSVKVENEFRERSNVEVLTVQSPTMPFTLCLQCKKQTNLVDDVLATNSGNSGVANQIDYRDLAVVSKYQESTLANIFGLLLSIQTIASEHLLTQKTTSNESFMNVVGRRSSMARMSVNESILAAVNNNSGRYKNRSGNSQSNLASNADAPRSLDQKSFIFSFFLFDLFDERFTLSYVLDFYNELQSQVVRDDRSKMNYTTFVKAYSIIAHAKFPASIPSEEMRHLLRHIKPAYDELIADPKHSVRRVAQAAGIVDTAIYAILAEHEESIVHSFKRSKNYGLNKRTTNSTSAGASNGVGVSSELIGSAFTSFEVFCINNHIVPNLISANATRRVSQFSGIIFKRDSISFVLGALYLLAVLKSQIDDLPDADDAQQVTAEHDRGLPRAANISGAHVLPILQSYIAKVLKHT